MITRLKRRFIILAMTSLTILLTVIVAGMNLINYNSVLTEADEKLEALSSNQGRLFIFFDDGLDYRIDEGGMGGRGGHAPSWMSRDEAEETRFFTVLADSEGNVIGANTDRIFSVDQDAAATYAKEALAKGNTAGFINDMRYIVDEESYFTRIIFLDCGRTLGAFRRFLYASIIMSLVGLAAVFGVICYFAGRIVKPVWESYEKQKRFITDAGHEIKTPLTIIKANLDVIRMDTEDALEAADADESGSGNEIVRDLTESLGESIDDIGTQVDRLTTLTNDLVYLSRMEEGGGSLTMTDVPLSEIVAETVDSFEPVAKERGKTILADIIPLLSIRGSTKELEKLVSILMENALKYSPEGDSIGVSLRRENKNVVLEVRNKTLTPVADEDLEHVFERFYRTDKSRNSAAGGHGIGLSMASAIVSAHGGKISARSGDGSEFIVAAVMPAN
ncbi:MAG: HAMP domain-containing histidine kinase [Mogibacterium sp.]|nr:HAMP domain-containing histidine kinase [Mogibacterium sp.]